MRKVVPTIAVIALALVIAVGFPERNSTEPPPSTTTTSAEPAPEQPPPAGDEQLSGTRLDSGASTAGPAQDYSYGRGYATEAPEATEIPEGYGHDGLSDPPSASDIAELATQEGLLLHRYEVGFHEQNQAMVHSYPVYDTAGYADNRWYTWSQPTAGMTILMNDPETGDNTSCTLGGFARDPRSGELYGITAGHCAEAGQAEVFWQPAGSSQLERLGVVALWQTAGRPGPDTPFSFDTDVAYILLDQAAADSVNPLIANTYQATAVYGPGDLTVGQRVCKMGYRTEQTCGSVVAVNESFVRVHLFTLPGDSGGLLYAPFEDGTAAVIGVLSGSPTFRGGDTHDFLADFALTAPVLADASLEFVS